MVLGVSITIGVIILIAIAVALFGFTTVRVSKGEAARVDPRMPSLRYRMPDFQDPPVLLAALKQAGYNATVDEVAGTKFLIVDCPAGLDRERARVRSLITDQNRLSVEGPEFDQGEVAFEDEKESETG